jgi:iron complex outermembrane receptor protein
MKSLNKRRLSLAVAAALGTTLTGVAFAQEAAEDEMVEEVLVTGTRIASSDGFGATSPVTVVTAENIQNLGFVNIEQVLNSLPRSKPARTPTFLTVQPVPHLSTCVVWVLTVL